jgi:hypothetical protein
MCSAVALPTSELSEDVIAAHPERIYTRDGADREFRFYLRAVPALLPVWWHGRLHVVRWGNRDRSDRRLPPSAWTWRETVEAGKWSGIEPEPVDVPARYGYANGVWFNVREGFRGLLVQPPGREPVVYLLCEPATRYYEVMTRSEWMPVLINEVI